MTYSHPDEQRTYNARSIIFYIYFSPKRWDRAACGSTYVALAVPKVSAIVKTIGKRVFGQETRPQLHLTIAAISMSWLPSFKSWPYQEMRLTELARDENFLKDEGAMIRENYELFKFGVPAQEVKGWSGKRKI